MVRWILRSLLLLGVYFETGFLTVITLFYIFFLLEGLAGYLKDNEEISHRVYEVE